MSVTIGPVIEDYRNHPHAGSVGDLVALVEILMDLSTLMLHDLAALGGGSVGKTQVELAREQAALADRLGALMNQGIASGSLCPSQPLWGAIYRRQVAALAFCDGVARLEREKAQGDEGEPS